MRFEEKQKMISNYFSRINILYRKLAKEYGLSYNTMLVLYAIKQQGACTQKQIVNEWKIPKQTVNTVVKDLEHKGYIYFTFDTNQKEKTIHFTEQATQCMSKSITEVQKIEQRIYETIGEKKCDVVLDAMEEFFEIFEQELSNRKERESKK